MALKDKLPVSYLLFTDRGRINRLTYWTASIFIWTSFYILYNFLNLFSYGATWAVYPLLFWALIATASKRLHDTDRTGKWLLLLLVPVLGPIALIFLLGFKKGAVRQNGYGPVPGSAPDYFKNNSGDQITHLKTEDRIINDVTKLNPVIVSKVETPETIADLQVIVRNATNPVSVGGGRFSMGGQTASPSSTHVDMRKLNKIISFSAEKKTIEVEAGTRWCDIQKFVDEHDLSIKIMQTYANFTVGGALSVNCHGRYIGLGPVILSVNHLQVVLANGELVRVSQNEKPEIFYACIGCYNAVAIIATVEFQLEENLPVKRVSKKMKGSAYSTFFTENIGNNSDVIFHNADLYPPNFKSARAVSWIKTKERPTVKTRLMPLSEAYPIERYFISAFSKSDFGKWRRQHIIDPILYTGKKIHWRNYEAGYDVAELEPSSRIKSTYVLQEYFIPVISFNEFSSRMSEIFIRHKVNVINVSIRHAKKDPGSLLAWAREEVFAFVVWYKQGTSDDEKSKVAIWTRELIECAISFFGSYYLPYQIHATEDQFFRAYPDAKKLFEFKKKLDPDFKFRNMLWNKYYK
jgi:FAD/FMN-containing dehydrogenase/uncharacterized membrane protein YhaH (DUF805 family)